MHDLDPLPQALRLVAHCADILDDNLNIAAAYSVQALADLTADHILVKGLERERRWAGLERDYIISSDYLCGMPGIAPRADRDLAQRGDST